MENVLIITDHKQTTRLKQTTWLKHRTILYPKTILYLKIKLSVRLVEAKPLYMIKIVNVTPMIKFVLNAIKTTNSTVKEFVSLNQQSLFQIVKLWPMEPVLNVKPGIIWIKVEIVSNYLQTVLQSIRQVHAQNVLKDSYWLQVVFVLNKLLTVPNIPPKECVKHVNQVSTLMLKVCALFFQPIAFLLTKQEPVPLVNLGTQSMLKEPVSSCHRIVTWPMLTVSAQNAILASISINKWNVKHYLITVLKLMHWEDVLNVKMIWSSLMVNV